MKAFLISIAIFINLNACALCALYSPTSHVTTKYETNNDKLSGVSFTWAFSENFTELMLQSFDINYDRYLDENELKEILRGLLDYLVPNDFLTKISYYYNNEDAKDVLIKVRDYDMSFDDNRLKFRLDIDLDIVIKMGLVISTEMFDKNEFFYFTFMDEKSREISPNIYLTQNANGNVNFFKFTTYENAKKDDNKPRLSDVINPQNEYAYIDEIDAAKFDQISQASLSFLDKIKQIFKQNKQNPSVFSLFMILFFSFIYGFLHAAGPGHAKLLTGSYFLANGGGYTKALAFALKVGFLHVFGAFLMVLAVFFTLAQTAQILSKDAAKITTFVCGIAIIIIALFMMYKKLQKPKIKWSPHAPSCQCASCKALNVPKTNKKEWLVAASLAIVPCPGVILVFILAFELGSYVSGILSGVFMGLGMSLVIFLAAILGQKLNQNILNKYKNFKIYVEIFALLVMTILGAFMIYASLRTGVF